MLHAVTKQAEKVNETTKLKTEVASTDSAKEVISMLAQSLGVSFNDANPNETLFEVIRAIATKK